MNVTRLDDLLHLLYRLDQLKNPSTLLRDNLLKEIQRCKSHSADDPSTNNAPHVASTKKPASSKQLTLV